MNVSVDPKKCEGHALCAGIAPRIFEVNSDDLAVVLDPDPADEPLRRAARAAAQSCPTMAITVTD